VPLNLELKARLPSLEQADRRARSIGASLLEEIRQTDTYFAVPNGRLKLREFDDGRSELIFYERPEVAPERQSSYSRIPLPSGTRLVPLLAKAVGIVTVVRKERRVFLYRGARIHLDRVDGMGTFLEFEVPLEQGTPGEPLMRELRSLFAIEDAHVLQASYADLSRSPERE
jgi:adenylate cyclase class IV